MAGIYLDSNVVIALVEEAPNRRASVVAQLSAAGHEPIHVVTDLVRLECRVKPMADGDTTMLAAHDGFFALPTVRVTPLTTAVCDRATAIRAHHGYPTADSRHLAAAIEAECDVFATADKRLAGFPDVSVVLINPSAVGGSSS